MSIGTTIKQLRKEKEITQEQLAEYLGITSRAVSQWECDRTAPDISQLPALANIFEVSADVLLGIDVTQKKKRIDEIIGKAKKHRMPGHNEEAAGILRNGLQEFPNSHKIMVDLMECLWNMAKNTDTEETKLSLLQEAISLGEKALEESTDDTVRHDAILLLCYIYPEIGENDKAIALAERMPSRFLSAEYLLSSVYTGTKRFEHIQRKLMTTVVTLHNDLCNNNAPLDDGTLPYTNSEFIQILQKYHDFLDIIFEDKNYGICALSAWRTLIQLAQCHMLEQQPEQALECLQNAAEHALWYDTQFRPQDPYTCLLFRGIRFGFVAVDNAENECLLQLKEMEKPVFDPIRQLPEFKKMVKELQEYAGVR